MNPPPLSTTTTCLRHPQEKNFTSFCPSCLFERLSVLDPNASNPSSSSSNRKSSASALKSIFFPELRRSKSFSASKHDAASSSVTAFEPQRKSCEVRIRTSFYNEPKIINNEANFENLASEEENEDEIQVVDETNVSDEIVEEEEEEEIEELKTMKDHIDLDSSQLKKPKSSFWSAATVFSKKLQKWRQKPKEEKEEKESKKLHHRKSVNKPPIGRRFGETQSEVADYGFGRRSCDVDPRYSLDVAGRISLDDPRYSLDEPRPSWDGYLTGRTGNFLKMPPPLTMLSVAEDDAPPPMVNAPSVVVNAVSTTDTQISVEEDEDSVIGGSAQTKEYYSDSSRRRKSFDRSNSIRRSEIDELSLKRSNSNSNSSSIVANANGFNVANVAKVNPLHGMKMDLNNGDGYFSAASVIDSDPKEEKKSRRWSIWGFIHRRSKNKDEDEDRDNRVNGNSGRLFRSNSSVSWRNSVNGNGNKGRDEFVFERNRSARYSAKDVDNNGLLRFYLTPLRGIRRNGSLKTSSKSNHTHSFARTVFG